MKRRKGEETERSSKVTCGHGQTVRRERAWSRKAFRPRICGALACQPTVNMLLICALTSP